MPVPDQLQKTWIPHLYGQFERARPILFTGAGFSLAAQSWSLISTLRAVDGSFDFGPGYLIAPDLA